MGWDFSNRERGMSTRAFFEREFPRADMLATATVGGTFYAAVEDPNDPGRVFALVCATQRARGYYNFGYKDMDEGTGPNDARAPARVLDLLTPLPDCPGGHAELWQCRTCTAADWRQRCRDNIAAAERAKAVTPGTTLRFAEAIDYGKWGVHQVLTFVKGTTFAGADGTRYTVPRWQARAWEVAAPAGVTA